VDILKGKEKIEKDKKEKKRKFLNSEIMTSSISYGDDLINHKRGNKKKNSISYFKTNKNLNHILKNIQNNYESDVEKNKLSLKKNKNGTKKVTLSKKQSLLDSINKNIERNQINLNNPDLYYAEYFHNILERKSKMRENHILNKEEEEFMSKLESKSTFSNLNTFNNNLKFNKEHM
jgi:hypothetical protein